MKYLSFALSGLVASKKTCVVDESDKQCEADYYWNEDACTCFVEYWCEIGCPIGQTNSPLEFCNCIYQCKYDELFTDEILCPRAFEGQNCEGFNEETGEPFASCADGLECEPINGASIPGAGNICVSESGSFFGLSVVAISLIAFSLF